MAAGVGGAAGREDFPHGESSLLATILISEAHDPDFADLVYIKCAFAFSTDQHEQKSCHILNVLYTVIPTITIEISQSLFLHVNLLKP